MKNVLVIDDDLKLQKMLQRTLIFKGFNVYTADNGQEGLSVIRNNAVDLIIVDWMMPIMDGITFIQNLRNEDNQTMVLMLTAKDAIENRVEGLQSGADDYLIKPFAPEELVARVEAMLRRVEKDPQHVGVSYSYISLDPSTRIVKIDDQEISLTVTEFKLLHFVLQHPKQVLERRQILNKVWGYDFYGDENVLEIYIGYLRKKLEKDGHPRLIQTVRGIGYVLREDQ